MQNPQDEREQMSSEPQRPHGGARPGAGRKPIDPSDVTARATISIPASELDELRALGGGNVSAAVRLLLEHQRAQRLRPDIARPRAKTRA